MAEENEDKDAALVETAPIVVESDDETSSETSEPVTDDLVADENAAAVEATDLVNNAAGNDEELEAAKLSIQDNSAKSYGDAVAQMHDAFAAQKQ